MLLWFHNTDRTHRLTSCNYELTSVTQSWYWPIIIKYVFSTLSLLLPQNNMRVWTKEALLHQHKRITSLVRRRLIRLESMKQINSPYGYIRTFNLAYDLMRTLRRCPWSRASCLHENCLLRWGLLRKFAWLIKWALPIIHRPTVCSAKPKFIDFQLLFKCEQEDFLQLPRSTQMGSAYCTCFQFQFARCIRFHNFDKQ